MTANFKDEWLPHFRPKHFQDKSEEEIFKLIKKCRQSTNEPLDKDVLRVELSQGFGGLNEYQYKEALKYIDEMPTVTRPVSREWLYEKTVRLYRDREQFVGIREAINALDNSRHEKVEEAFRAVVDAGLFDPRTKNLVVNIKERLRTYKRPEYLIDKLFKRLAGFMA